MFSCKIQTAKTTYMGLRAETMHLLSFYSCEKMYILLYIIMKSPFLENSWKKVRWTIEWVKTLHDDVQRERNRYIIFNHLKKKSVFCQFLSYNQAPFIYRIIDMTVLWFFFSKITLLNLKSKFKLNGTRTHMSSWTVKVKLFITLYSFDNDIWKYWIYVLQIGYTLYRQPSSNESDIKFEFYCLSDINIGIIVIWGHIKKDVFFFLFYVFFDVESESEVSFCRSPLFFEL